MKIKSNFFIIVGICIVLAFVSAADMSCNQSNAAKSGLDFLLVSRPGFINSGSLISQGDIFNVGVHLENYDSKERSGMICLRDDVEDGFGGISSGSLGECQSFVIRAAERTDVKKTGILSSSSSQVNPGILEVFFPSSGQEYSYYGMPEMLNPYTANLYVTVQYNEITDASATITVPGQDQPVMAQEPAMLQVGVVKEIHPRENGYLVDLAITLTKQANAGIYTPDLSRENITQMNINLIPLSIGCSVLGKPFDGTMDVSKTATVKCSAIINNNQAQGFPLVVSLAYGVQIQKSFGFNIKTKQT